MGFTGTDRVDLMTMKLIPPEATMDTSIAATA